MTDEQIRARCREILADFTRAEHCKQELDILESLCREMVAEGLEMSANEALKITFLHGNDRRRERNALDDHSSWCREEAARLKESNG